MAIRSALVVVLALTAGCPTDDGGGGVCGNGYVAESGTVGDFGATAAAQKVEALLHASADLYAASVDVEGDVYSACTTMAADLGIAAGELQPATGELRVTKACTRVVQEIDAIIDTLPNGVALGITITPAQCTVDVELGASCAAECDASISGTAMVECMGELHGSCSGSCSGSCVVMGTVSCTGECSGTCTGTCSGTCHGTCTAGCSATDSMGNCVGTCSGTCTGTCDAMCSGSCTGSCESDVTGSCTGECYGSCDATWMAECNGEADIMANAECKAACETRANANAECDPPTVTIVGVVVADTAKKARIDALVATLKTNYPKILAAQAKAQYSLVPATASFGTSLRAASTSLASVGVQAAACMGVAVDSVVEATSQVNASVSVSVMVSASVSASGSGG
jgi:hypothetical protein